MDVRRVMTIALGCAALSLAVLVGGASAALHLDPSFGSGGIVKLPGHPHRYAPEVLAEEPDGGLIVDREGALERLDPAGKLDTGFGEAGTAAVPQPATGKAGIAAVAIDSSGRIVVVGTSTPEQPAPNPLPLKSASVEAPRESEHSDVRILRYLPNGTLDPSF